MIKLTKINNDTIEFDTIDEYIEYDKYHSRVDINDHLNIGINNLDLTVACHNSLDLHGIGTIRELINTSEMQLKQIEGLGAAGICKIKEALSERNLSLIKSR